jgi:hypothetical protein
MAAADAEGAGLADAAVVGAGLEVEAAVGTALGDEPAEQAASAMASAGTRRAMDRFMTDGFPSGLGLDVVSDRTDGRSI